MYGVLESCLFALVCIQIELQRNFKLCCLNFFFRNLSFQIGGAAYLRVRLIPGTLRYLSNKYSYYQFRQPTDCKRSMNSNYFHAYSPFHYDLFKHERSIDYKCSILPSFHTFNLIKPCHRQTMQNVSRPSFLPSIA